MFKLVILLMAFVSPIVAQVLTTCGDLPPPSPLFSSLVAFEPSNLPPTCAQWQGKKACCTYASATLALEEIETGNISKSTERKLGDSEHCFYGYYAEICEDVLQWITCATACDVLFPRNKTNALPQTNICYEKFTKRRGIDRILYQDYKSACAYAGTFTSLGNCGAVIVVGQKHDVAVAIGRNRAICYSWATKLGTNVFNLALLLIGRLILIA